MGRHIESSPSVNKLGWPKTSSTITATQTQVAIAIKTKTATATSTADCTLGPKIWPATSVLRAGTFPITKTGKS